jgi:hypothetical protein
VRKCLGGCFWCCVRCGDVFCVPCCAAANAKH